MRRRSCGSIACPSVQLSTPISVGSITPGSGVAPIQNGKATIHQRMTTSFLITHDPPPALAADVASAAFARRPRKLFDVVDIGCPSRRRQIANRILKFQGGSAVDYAVAFNGTQAVHAGDLGSSRSLAQQPRRLGIRSARPARHVQARLALEWSGRHGSRWSWLPHDPPHVRAQHRSS
jgi:hypothetical protein